MLNKCSKVRATLLVPDVEDSVPPNEKATARSIIAEHLPQIRQNAFSPDVVITPRTNQPSLEDLFFADMKGLVSELTLPYIDGICVPKVDTVKDIKVVDETLREIERNYGLDSEHTLKVIPQIESTLSLVNMNAIFEYDQSQNQTPRIIAAAFGGDDFTADFGVRRSDDDRQLDFARKLFALNCHAYGITSIDTPYVHYKDMQGLNNELQYLKDIGMKAKFAIHPTQVEEINNAFCPSDQDVEYYSDMVDQFERAQEEEGKAAINFREKMVDIAAYRRAKEIL